MSYDAQDKILGCDAIAYTVGSGGNSTLNVSFDGADTAAKVKAFTLDAATHAPIQGVWSRTLK